MTKPLQQQLAELSVRAQRAEDAIAAAWVESREEVRAQRDQARFQAAEAADRVENDLKRVGEAISGQWKVLQEKVAWDISRSRGAINEREVERRGHRAADRAARLESEAEVAIDYAVASIEEAKLAVFDAIVADREAAETRQH